LNETNTSFHNLTTSQNQFLGYVPCKHIFRPIHLCFSAAKMKYIFVVVVWRL